jgi:hypothetical protein
MLETLRALIQRLRKRSQRAEQSTVPDVRRFSGLLPICAYCHAIRDDSLCWRRFEEYLTDRLDVIFTHGICPKCQVKGGPLHSLISHNL